MSLDLFISFFTILFVATIVPGPSMLLALNHGAFYGFKRAFISCIGYLLANLLMALLSYWGLGAILLTSAIAFNIIKWCGIAYLIYIGISMLLAKNNEETDKKETNTFKKTNNLKLFTDGFVIAAGNPKGIIFFTALFPQFININNATISEVGIVFSTLASVAFACYMLYAAFGRRLSNLFRRASFKKFFNKVSGSLFIGLGITMAFSRR